MDFISSYHFKSLRCRRRNLRPNETHDDVVHTLKVIRRHVVPHVVEDVQTAAPDDATRALRMGHGQQLVVSPVKHQRRRHLLSGLEARLARVRVRDSPHLPLHAAVRRSLQIVCGYSFDVVNGWVGDRRERLDREVEVEGNKRVGGCLGGLLRKLPNHGGPRLWARARVRRRHHADEREHALWHHQGHGLPNHAPHGHTPQVRLLDLEAVEQCEGVERHVLEVVPATHAAAPAQPREDELDGRRRADARHLRGQPHVTVVEADHVEPSRREHAALVFVPHNHLPVESHQKEERGVLGHAERFVAQVDVDARGVAEADLVGHELAAARDVFD
eukprot:PhM_4_TR11336/c0_g1_i2/m.103958